VVTPDRMVADTFMLQLGNPTVKQRVVDRVAALSPGASSNWGRMTAHGMVCHLSDSFRVPLGERSASMATGLYQRTVMKWAALYVVVRWPHNRPTRPEVEQGVGGSLPEDFQADRDQLLRLIERFSACFSEHFSKQFRESGRRFDRPPHPLFGAMTGRQWLRWGYLHADHHLRQFGV
jgi:hypothetical protein